MKKLFLGKIVLVFMGFLFFGVMSIAQESNVMEQDPDLPVPIRDFINQHYTPREIVVYEVKWTPFKTKYKVELDNKTKIKFDKDYEVIEVESKSGVPLTLLPAPIREYISKNYPDDPVWEWEIKRDKQEVEFRSGLELEFDLTGKFIRIDR